MGERLISEEGLRALNDVLCGSYTVPLGTGGEALLMVASLPGRAIVVAARIKGVLVVCVDLDKPCAPKHARAMLEEWRQKSLGDVVIPTPRKEPCPVNLTAA